MSIKDAEIARLKAEAESLVEQFRSIRELCYSKDKLITELADSLSDREAYPWIYISRLIEKARKEVDHELG